MPAARIVVQWWSLGNLNVYQKQNLRRKHTYGILNKLALPGEAVRQGFSSVNGWADGMDGIGRGKTGDYAETAKAIVPQPSVDYESQFIE